MSPHNSQAEILTPSTAECDYIYIYGASLIAQSVKNPPAMQETWVQSLGREDPLGEGNGNPLQYSCLENRMDRGAWQATVHEVTRIGHD